MGAMVHKRARPQMCVKALEGVTIVCQKSGCEQPAVYLFRGAAIAGYCEPHSRIEARSFGIDLPTALAPQSEADFSVRSAAVKSNSAA
jgi:hypothetical protein